ncbi:MAG TPA: crosslink repair DNA glycosylase YcaQ family protein [Anaerolineae bacterium]|nr:crosslink repair DNA glycosylase YcaQ family protein [Anaerolineae bacterium]HQI83678.1 crosslink repair DNA glycosylase YcaQ family protein [Anaerolineae bacterium]
MKISLATARQLALRAHGLDGGWILPPGKEGAAQIIERLGYVQIDTIHIIQRAHHHTLWTRFPQYAPEMLDDLLAKDRRVFEWWTHAMAYIPMRDYRFYAPRMGYYALWGRQREWLIEYADVIAHVKERIRAEGPLGASDFEHPQNTTNGWWDWKPAKQALEILASMGELMVTKRHNFQRIFDLTERVLPPDVDTTPPTDEELQRFIVRFALNTGGVLRQSEVQWSRRKADPAALQAMVETGEVTAFEVEGLNGEPCYALSDVFEAVTQSPNGEPHLHILSPFDNLIIDRRWLKAFFDGFEYTIECYVPEAKRKYGYFVLPILWGDRFVARLDSKADRKPKTFVIKRLLFEPGFAEYDAVLLALVEKLRAFAAFNGCDNFAVEDVQPEKVKAPLEQMLSAFSG